MFRSRRSKRRSLSVLESYLADNKEKGATNVIRGVANIWRPVADVDRAVGFYENILAYLWCKGVGRGPG